LQSLPKRAAAENVRHLASRQAKPPAALQISSASSAKTISNNRRNDRCKAQGDATIFFDY